MIRTNLFQPSNNRKISAKKGAFSVLEYDKDLSVKPSSAINAYFSAEMNIHRRQVIATLNGTNAVTLQAGAMQLMMGDITLTSNIQGAGDLVKKFFAGKVTKESTVKPTYSGSGVVVLEPTYKHILLEDLREWNGSMVIEDGLFLACDNRVALSVVARTNLSSAIAGGEGLFNLALNGDGIAVLESPVPREELIIVDIENDTLKIDGNMAIAWTAGLDFTVERSGTTLMGSAASGEGLVNVYRGTGRVLIAPVQ